MFSAVVVALAFAATTMAFNSSTSSATRDINKSGALTVAQGQLEYMRSVGQKDINELIAMEGTTRNVNYGGVDYSVSYRAYYVDSMGGGNSNSCGSFASSGSTSAQYIYIKVTINYEVPVSAPAFSMDSYYAPEGGSSQSSTGTLKVFVLSPSNTPMTFPNTVNLKLGNATVDTETINANGCVLFTGLARGVYTISIPDSALQDLYMTSGGSTYERSVSMPARGAIVQKVQLANPVTITPTFKTKTTATTDEVVTPSTANDYVKDALGSNPTIAKWVGMNSSIVLPGFTDYTLNPGKVFMPHFTPNPTTMASQIYPDLAGYTAYAGSCTANNPGSANLKPITSPSWANPELWLTRLNATASVSGSTTMPTPSASTTYYWNQRFSSANIKVRLVGDYQGNSPEESDCGPRPSLYNDSWISLGNISTNNGSIATAMQALPTGEYEVCAAIDYLYSRGTGYRQYSWSSWTMNSITHNLTDTEYVLLSPGVLTYQQVPVTRASSLASPTPGSTTSCG